MTGTERLAGVLLHSTSLPSGKIDIDGDRWLDWLANAGFGIWQMLPLCMPNFGLSPYQCLSAFALNPEHISKIPSLKSRPGLKVKYKEFKSSQKFWLEDFALFMVLREFQDQAPWYEWPPEYKNRKRASLNKFHDQHIDLLEDIYWQQFFIFYKWQQLKAKAHTLGIKFFGDVPIFVAHDSVDVWTHPEFFLLDENKMPGVVAGVPPDYYSKTGQRWGNPHYAWDLMQANNFAWWRSRFEHLTQLFDILRIDHFRGLSKVWQIEASCDTAIDGKWVETPGRELLQTIQNISQNIELVAEDLGIITTEVKQLRKDFNLPGMAVLQFGFEGGEDNPHHPDNLEADTIVYTGTHDNDTLAGWYDSLTGPKKSEVHEALRAWDKKSTIRKLKTLALRAKSYISILPLQDILELPGDARMNTPGTADNNWQWRFAWEQLPDNLTAKLKLQLEKAGRLSR